MKSPVSEHAPAHWHKPPFIERTWLRSSLYLGALLYLVLATASLEVNWTRVSEGLIRGLAFITAFLQPDFTSRHTDIV